MPVSPFSAATSTRTLYGAFSGMAAEGNGISSGAGRYGHHHRHHDQTGYNLT